MIKKQQLGLFSLTGIGVGTMIGSGWLFSAYYASQIAGPLVFFSWVFTSILILLLGLSLSEIATNYPKNGLMVRLLVFSHSKEFSFICSASAWLGLTAVIASEAVGTVQYISSISVKVKSVLFSETLHQLTQLGLLSAAALIFLFGLFNFWGAKLMSKSNNVITFVKIFIPSLTAVAILLSSFHSANFSLHNSATSGVTFYAVFSAMFGAGMIYSFNGFQNIVSFSALAKNSTRNIPLSMFLSIVITLCIYLLLQICFIGALSPAQLSQGWSNINFTSPFVELAMTLNLHFIMIILYADAIISPSGTGLIYTGSTTRLLTGMSEERQLPKFFSKKCRYDFSRRSLYATVIIACCFLFLFRSWTSLVSFLSLFYLISYMAIPLCMGKCRHFGIVGKFKLKGAQVISPVLFVLISILFDFSTFPDSLIVSVLLLIAVIIYGLVQHLHFRNGYLILKQSTWLLIYFCVLSSITLLNPQLGWIPWGLSPILYYAIQIIWALFGYYIMVFMHSGKPMNPKKRP